MTTKTMKYEIIKPIDDTWETLGKALNQIQYQTWKFANKAIQMLWDFDNLSISFKECYGEWLDMKEKPINGYVSIEGYILNVLKNDANLLNVYSKGALIRMISKKWKSDLSKVRKGERSIANFKRDLPIELHNKQFMKTNNDLMIYKENNNYYAEIALVSREYSKELGKKSCSFKLLLGAKDNTQRAILDRVINKEYKLSMSKISKIKKGKTKWFLNLAYTFEPQKVETLNEDRIMGVDLGVNIPAFLAINDDQFFRAPVGNKAEMESFRNQVMKRKNELLRQGKWCGEGRIGRGIKTRRKPVDKLEGKIENFKNLKNHCWSKYIVDLAVKKQCGTIQMEDLTGIADGEKKATFLGNWSYYDLQAKIKYKALEKGIKVVMIEPKYTSARCNQCGHIHRSEMKHIWRPSQEQFKCMNCDYGHKFFVNADFNAAKNIATKGIEGIIKQQLEKQEKEERNVRKYVI